MFRTLRGSSQRFPYSEEFDDEEELLYGAYDDDLDEDDIFGAIADRVVSQMFQPSSPRIRPTRLQMEWVHEDE
jgi:hypothetical protein